MFISKMDILIRAKREAIAHKFADGELVSCWWTVSGTPRRAEAGDNIYFSDGERIFAEGKILGVEEGRITFTPLELVDKSQPKKPPTRGFTYIP